jgi:hypothetical protein
MGAVSVVSYTIPVHLTVPNGSRVYGGEILVRAMVPNWS